jgi:hypothetical protein
LPRVLLGAAYVYGLAARPERGRGPAGPRDRFQGLEASRRRTRAAELLLEALKATPTYDERAALWRDHIRDEPSLAVLRGSAVMQKLEEEYGPRNHPARAPTPTP